MSRTNYEERFYAALKRITKYQTPEQLRRFGEKHYGLTGDEALAMAYENMQGEAENALRGYRKPRDKSTQERP